MLDIMPCYACIHKTLRDAQLFVFYILQPFAHPGDKPLRIFCLVGKAYACRHHQLQARPRLKTLAILLESLAVQHPVALKLAELWTVNILKTGQIASVKEVPFQKVVSVVRHLSSCHGIVQAHTLSEAVAGFEPEYVFGNLLLMLLQHILFDGKIFGAPQVAGRVFEEEILKEIHRAPELQGIPLLTGKPGNIPLPQAARSRGYCPYSQPHLLSETEVMCYGIDHKGHNVVRRIRHLLPQLFKIAVDGINLAAFAAAY